jgi:hypothetical protein
MQRQISNDLFIAKLSNDRTSYTITAHLKSFSLIMEPIIVDRFTMQTSGTLQMNHTTFNKLTAMVYKCRNELNNH